ncbi:MAG: RNA polymerase sigma factor [bacterium]
MRITKYKVKLSLMINEKDLENKTDEQIVALTLENQDCFLGIIKKYKTKLYGYIRRISNVSPQDAEDILQDVFIKAYLNLNDFDTDLKFSSWIYRIAHNQVISQHRKKQARPEGYAVELEDTNAQKFILDFEMEKNIDTRLLRKNIFKILNNLDERYKEIIILKFFEEKSYQEISDIIQKPMGTVASLMNKAKKEFKKVLDAQGGVQHL